MNIHEKKNIFKITVLLHTVGNFADIILQYTCNEMSKLALNLNITHIKADLAKYFPQLCHKSMCIVYISPGIQGEIC